ncbi:hypothetical protein LWI28_025676 [Acer negundo]|uniref:Uncharacterized protein n=1 Tax=Acer negundo TaxID=4023 RepID=A0AAD5IGB5_ACENE|nr:hypothetical protein LWI28_025676 [Acer negundo]
MQTTQRVNLLPDSNGKLKVLVALGEKLISLRKCSQVQLKLQKVSFFIDVFILPLERYDLVLGTQWLRTHGPIQWNFETLEMTFWKDAYEVTLHGISNSHNKVSDTMPFNKITKKQLGIVLQLIKGEEVLSRKDSIHFPVQQLLDDYNEILTKPEGLPPPRSQDYNIPMQPGCGPVATSLYRYPHFQKHKIEKQVREMLEVGII